MSLKKSIKIQQGSTFEFKVRWQASDLTFKPITHITTTAPPVITCPAHGLPDNWEVAITDVQGTTELNASDPANVTQNDFHRAQLLTTDTIALKNINASSYGAYVSGGLLRYYAPNSLAGYTARMQIRETLEAAEIILELTTENGGIVLDTGGFVIDITISAAATALLDFTSAVYSLEMVAGTVVTEILSGRVKLIKEVTRDG